MRLFENASFDFWGNRKRGFLISAVLIAISLVSLVYPGLEAGIDFLGGTEFIVQTAEPVDPVDARGFLAPVLGDGVEVKEYGDARTLLVRTTAGGDIDSVQSELLTALEAVQGANPVIEDRFFIGPRFAEDLKRGALWAVFGSLIVILGYIFLRFDWRYALGAVGTLAHDVVIVVGIFALFHNITPFSLQMDQTIIAALLTIVGYSVNDTVVVFDRIREYYTMFKTKPYEEVANLGINATLSRTVITSVTTLITVFVLFVLGGEALRGFALALLTGITLGTYSSIFVSSPLVVMLRRRFPEGKAKLVRG